MCIFATRLQIPLGWDCIQNSGSNRGQFCLLRDIWQFLLTFFIVPNVICLDGRILQNIYNAQETSQNIA